MGGVCDRLSWNKNHDNLFFIYLPLSSWARAAWRAHLSKIPRSLGALPRSWGRLQTFCGKGVVFLLTSVGNPQMQGGRRRLKHTQKHTDEDKLIFASFSKLHFTKITRWKLLKKSPGHYGVDFRKERLRERQNSVPHSNKNHINPIYSFSTYFCKQIFA